MTYMSSLINSLSLNTFNVIAISGQYVLIVGVTYQIQVYNSVSLTFIVARFLFEFQHFHSSVFQRFHKVNLNILVN